MNNGNNGNDHAGVASLRMALAGMALGAAAVALTHKPTREKLIDALDNWGNKLDSVKEKGKQKVDELAVKAKLAENEAEEKLKEVGRRSRNTAKRMTDNS